MLLKSKEVSWQLMAHKLLCMMFPINDDALALAKTASADSSMVFASALVPLLDDLSLLPTLQ